MNIFNIISNISSSKKDISSESEFNKIYNQYLVNYNFSLHPDSVLFANEINQYSGIPDKFHYLFYHNVLAKKSRFAKWPKQTNTDKETLLLVKDYYNVNEDKARDILELLDEEVVGNIKKSYGGMKK
jgi:hypothetical protein